jgi:hypothetical protein
MHIVMNEAVVTTTTANGGILHYFSPGALDGFAIGALLSGLILLVMVPRLMRRAQPRGMFRDYFATPNDGGQFAAALSALQERAAAAGVDDITDVDTEAYEVEELAEAVEKAGPANDTAEAEAAPDDTEAARDDLVEACAETDDAAAIDEAEDYPADADPESDQDGPIVVSNGAHRSKHRTSARPSWRIEVRRGQPRHAARSGALST